MDPLTRVKPELTHRVRPWLPVGLNLVTEVQKRVKDGGTWENMERVRDYSITDEVGRGGGQQVYGYHLQVRINTAVSVNTCVYILTRTSKKSTHTKAIHKVFWLRIFNRYCTYQNV